MPTQAAQFNVGDILQLQLIPIEGEKRYPVRIIGYIPGKSLLVTVPRQDKKPLILPERQRFNARAVSEDSVQAFTANLIKACIKPFYYMHLTYPKLVECVVIRKAQRVRVALAIGVANKLVPDRKDMSAVLVDISLSGAKLKSRQPLGKSGHHLQLGCELSVAGEDEMVEVIGTVRNVEIVDDSNSPDEVEYHYGLEFESLEREQRLLINGFVLEQIMLGRGS